MWANLDSAILARLPRVSANGIPGGLVGTLADGWQRALDKLNHYRTYANDWDGQGAAGIDHRLIDCAEKMADALRRGGVSAPTCALPGVDGTVSLEWDLGGRVTVQLEFNDPGVVELWVLAPDRPIEHEVLAEELAA